MNLRKIDLNLLTVFEVLYEERSQQKACERLFMSQPAVSQALSRLRHTLDDRLFFGSKTLLATGKADEIYIQVHHALELIRSQMLGDQKFSPKTTQRTFTVAISYGSGYLLGSSLYQLFEEQAPNARLVIRTVDPQDEIPRLLREHQIDIAMTNRHFNDDMLDSEYGLDFEIVIVTRAGHPTITQQPTREALANEHYLWVHDSTQLSEVAELQEFIRMAESRTKMEVPNALMVPIILSQSNLITVLPRLYADRMKLIYPLAIYDLPYPQLTNNSRLFWHRSRETDAGHYWFRHTFTELIKKQFYIA